MFRQADRQRPPSGGPGNRCHSGSSGDARPADCSSPDRHLDREPWTPGIAGGAVRLPRHGGDHAEAAMVFDAGVRRPGAKSMTVALSEGPCQ
jgi:hypothetical protein